MPPNLDPFVTANSWKCQYFPAVFLHSGSVFGILWRMLMVRSEGVCSETEMGSPHPAVKLNCVQMFTWFSATATDCFISLKFSDAGQCCYVCNTELSEWSSLWSHISVGTCAFCVERKKEEFGGLVRLPLCVCLGKTPPSCLSIVNSLLLNHSRFWSDCAHWVGTASVQSC